MKLTIQTRGVEGVTEFFRSRALNLAGGPRTVQVVARGARNTLIAAVQAAQDRNPFFVTATEARQIAGLARAALTDFLRTGQRLDLTHVGEQMVENARAHIDAKRSGGRPPISAPTSGHATRPLTREYARRKAALYGAGLPPLVATGEFYGSLDYRVVR